MLPAPTARTRRDTLCAAAIEVQGEVRVNVLLDGDRVPEHRVADQTRLSASVEPTRQPAASHQPAVRVRADRLSRIPAFCSADRARSIWRCGRAARLP